MPHEFLVDTQLFGLKTTKIALFRRSISRPPPKGGLLIPLKRLLDLHINRTMLLDLLFNLNGWLINLHASKPLLLSLLSVRMKRNCRPPGMYPDMTFSTALYPARLADTDPPSP